MKRSGWHIALLVLGALALLAGLALVGVLYAAHQRLAAALALLLLCGAGLIYASPRFYAWRYVVPGALAATVLPFRSLILVMPGFTTMPSAP